nr:TetR/AcrR family transcriptional regulator [Propionibacterium sp.]
MPRYAYPPDLRDRLIVAAADRLAAGGPQGLSLRELAASQGTSTNAVYTIFGGKPELIAAVVTAARDGFVAAQQEALADGDSLQTLGELGRAYRRWALANPSLYRVMFAGDPYVDPGRPRLEGLVPLRGALTRLIDAGLVREVDVTLAARSLWAWVHGWVMLEIADGATPDPDSDAAFDGHLRASLVGIASDALRATLA